MPRVIVRETASELPGATSALGGLFEGDLAVALDSGVGYFWNGAAWVPLAVSVFTPGVTTTSISYVVLSTDAVILVDATGGDLTISLPAASAQAGRLVQIKKIDASFHKVVLDADGADLIDGEPTLELLYEDESVPIVSDGLSEWSVL